MKPLFQFFFFFFRLKKGLQVELGLMEAESPLQKSLKNQPYMMTFIEQIRQIQPITYSTPQKMSK